MSAERAPDSPTLDLAAPLVGIVGVGELGGALLTGLLRGGHPAARLLAAARSPEQLAAVTDRYRVGASSAVGVAEQADVLLLAVEPRDVRGLLADLSSALRPGAPVLSLAAGTPLAALEAALPGSTPVLRGMTNTPVALGEAMSVVAAGTRARDEHVDLVVALLGRLGTVLRLPEEQLDAVTALSGTGPAYFYFLVEAMVDAGILLGLPRATAHDLIVQTAVGSAAMLRDSGKRPVVLRESVTSPAGTAIRAIRVLEDHGVRAAVLAALEAARDRSRELGEDEAP